MFHISLLAVPASCKPSSSESACIMIEQEIVCDVAEMEQLEMADAPPASSCPSLHSAGGLFSPPHLHISIFLALLLSIPPSKAVSFSLWICPIVWFVFVINLENMMLFILYVLNVHYVKSNQNKGSWTPPRAAAHLDDIGLLAGQCVIPHHRFPQECDWP